MPLGTGTHVAEGIWEREARKAHLGVDSISSLGSGSHHARQQRCRDSEYFNSPITLLV